MILINIPVPRQSDGVDLTRAVIGAGLSVRRATLKDNDAPGATFYAEVSSDPRLGFGPVADCLTTLATTLGRPVYSQDLEWMKASPGRKEGMTWFPRGVSTVSAVWFMRPFPEYTREALANMNRIPSDAFLLDVPPVPAAMAPGAYAQRLGRVHRRHTEPNDGGTQAWLCELWSRVNTEGTGGRAPITHAELRRLLRLTITGAE